MKKITEALFYWVVSITLTAVFGVLIPYVIYIVSVRLGVDGDHTKGMLAVASYCSSC